MIRHWPSTRQGFGVAIQSRAGFATATNFGVQQALITCFTIEVDFSKLKFIECSEQKPQAIFNRHFTTIAGRATIQECSTDEIQHFTAATGSTIGYHSSVNSRCSTG